MAEAHPEMEPMSQDEDHEGNLVQLSSHHVEPSTYIVHHITQDQIEQIEHIHVHQDSSEQNQTENNTMEMDEFLKLKYADGKHISKERISRMRRKKDQYPKAVYKKSFTMSWLQSPDFKDWLQKHPTNVNQAICKVCNKVLLAGKSELLKHGRSKKHRRFLRVSVPWVKTESLSEDNSENNLDESIDGRDIDDDTDLKMNARDKLVEDPIFKDWLLKHADSPYKVICKVCNTLLLAKKQDCLKHRITKKHRGNMISSGLAPHIKEQQEHSTEEVFDTVDMIQPSYSIQEGQSEPENQEHDQHLYEEYTEIPPHRIIKINAAPNSYNILNNSNRKSNERSIDSESPKQAFVTLPAPDWRGTALVNGHVTELKLADYKGRYLVMFFYPQDFSPVCSTEILALNEVISAFRVINCEIVACSVDSHLAHLAWTKTLGSRSETRILVPLLSDATHVISKSYGCFLESSGHTLRAYYIIDKRGIVRAMSMSDLQVGRNLTEILRMIEAFQLTDSTDTQCPANWTSGQPSVKIVL